MTLSRYAKAAVAVAGAALFSLQAAISDNQVTPSEWVGIALAAVTALGVWAVPNKKAAGDTGEGGEHDDVGNS